MIGELVKHKGTSRATTRCIRGQVGIVVAAGVPYTVTSHDLGGSLDTDTRNGIEVMTKDGDILLSHRDDWEVVK